MNEYQVSNFNCNIFDGVIIFSYDSVVTSK